MLNIFRFIKLLILTCLLSTQLKAGALCEGRFPNPVTDICWKCLFPLYIGPAPIKAGQKGNGDKPPPLIHWCPIEIPPFYLPGIGISFWEPARIAEVVRTPWCFPTLGGITMGSGGGDRGGHARTNGEEKGNAFYQVHWMTYPVLSWLSMAFTAGACQTTDSFDIAYFSELDPLWDDDSLSNILNPESILFANPIAQIACVADSVKAGATRFGINKLFWCGGSQGSIYPLNGGHANHIGGVDTAELLVQKTAARLHRSFLALDTSTDDALCRPQAQAIMRKTQYKTNIQHPVPWTRGAYGFGAHSMVYGVGKEYPYKGEQFTFVVWRKRKCVLF